MHEDICLMGFLCLFALLVMCFGEVGGIKKKKKKQKERKTNCEIDSFIFWVC